MARSNEKLVATVYCPRGAISESSFQSLWDHFGDDPFSATRYDSTEPVKQFAYSRDSWRDAYRLYQDLSCLVRGKAVTAMVQPAGVSDPVAFWTLWINDSALRSDASRAKWLEWFAKMFVQCPIYFAFACMESEFRAKHQVAREMPVGLQRAEDLGWRPLEFLKSLPGVYWLNYYGKEITAHLGARIRNNQDFSIRELDDGNLMAVLKEPPVAPDLKARIALERRIADELGSQYFFDNGKVEITGSIEGNLQVKEHAARLQIPELLTAISAHA